MKTLVLTIALACHLLISHVAMAQDLRLTLSLDRDTLLESQAIWASVALVNQSPSPKEVQAEVLTEAPSTGIRFRLADETGATTTRFGGVIDEYLQPPNPRLIAPGDSVTQMFNILAWFSNSGIKNAPVYLPTQHYLKAGTYRLQAIQFTGKDTLTSELAILTIVKPSGNTLNALRALRLADKKYAYDRNYDGASQEYEQFTRSFPQSVYGPYVYNRLIFIYYHTPIQNMQKVLELIAKMARVFPDDTQTLAAVSTYTPIILREGRRDILEGLARDYPSTKVGQLCRRKLEELRHK